LPPNNGTTGQGYVTFSLNVDQNTAKHFSQINADAEIIFDANEPILTPEIFHTIDTEPPVIGIAPNEELMTLGQFGLNLNKFDNGSGVGNIDIYEYEPIKDEFKFLLSTQQELIIIPFSEKRNYIIAALGNDLVGNKQLFDQLVKIDVNFDYNITCPNACSNHGKCDESGICSCDKNYVLTDCSFYYDGTNQNTFQFEALVGEYHILNTSSKSFELELDLNSSYTFTDVRITVRGLPNGSLSSSGVFNVNNSLEMASFDRINLTLPENFKERLELEIELRLKYKFLEFVELKRLLIDRFEMKPVFEITNIECLLNETLYQNYTTKIEFKFDLISSDNHEFNASISIVGLMANESDYSIELDSYSKNGSIEINYYSDLIQFRIELLITTIEDEFVLSKKLKFSYCQNVQVSDEETTIVNSENNELTTINMNSNPIDITDQMLTTTSNVIDTTSSTSSSLGKPDNGNNYSTLIIVFSVVGTVVISSIAAVLVFFFFLFYFLCLVFF
jgi:hypothetical protein